MEEQIYEAFKYINSQGSFKPDYGIILGTGLGALVKEVDIDHVIPYDQIPNFPISTVESHTGKLIFGKLSGKSVVVMQGRFHFYEGYSMKQVVFPIRVMKLLGIKKLFVSNAAGGLNTSFQLSELMVINDHINLMTENPLTGKNLDNFGVRFPDMSEPYDLKMVNQALQIGKNNGFAVHQGVYVGVTGPNLETKAEYKFLQIIGADAVGMSTVPEIIVARQMEIPCFALSVITDLCFPETLKKISVEEVIAAAMKAEPNMTLLIKSLLAKQP